MMLHPPDNIGRWIIRTENIPKDAKKIEEGYYLLNRKLTSAERALYMLPPKEIRDLQDKLETCADHIQRFNDWEQNFIESSSDQLTRTGYLSEKQLEILDGLYNKIK